MFKTGEYITSDIKNEDYFSSDNWGTRSAQLLPSVRGLSDASWDTIYDNSLATFKTHKEMEPVEDPTVELTERFEMLRSDPDYHIPEPFVDGDSNGKGSSDGDGDSNGAG